MQKANIRLHRFSKLVVAATLGLIFIGGMVTSRDAGLAVPDWPTSYGYNMFALPFKFWTGGVFYEHTHRLWASTVGLLVVALTRWLGGRASRRPLAIIGLAEALTGVGIFFLRPDLKDTGHFLTGIGGVILLAALVWMRNEPADRTSARLGWVAFALVQFQGLLGGLRVTKLSLVLAMIHGCTAQAFLCVLIVLAVALSPRWMEGGWNFTGKNLNAIRWLSWLMVASVYCQLILGAVMRHMKAGLAIGDFPSSFGRLIPPMWSAQIAIHFSHRVGALWVSLVTIALVSTILASAMHQRELRRPALGILVLVAIQIALGAHVIWLAKAPVVTTLHVVNGAAILGTSLLLALRASRFVLPHDAREVSYPTHSIQEARA